MTKRLKYKVLSIGSVIILLSCLILPIHVAGEVQPITDMQDKLEGISEEEKAVLEKLFTIAQEISDLEKEEDRLNGEISSLQKQITELETKLEDKQKDYDQQLEILKQVMVSYQRGGPATYLEVLLKADDFSTFLKSLNVMKDISHNVNKLLATLEKGKKEIVEEKDKLSVKVTQLEEKKEELKEPIRKQKVLQTEQETYLASLKEQGKYYEEQLSNIEQMWSDCKLLFNDMVGEITKIASDGYFTMEDLNLNFGFTKMDGQLYEDTFNSVLKEHTKLPETIFTFHDGYIEIEVPDKHLRLKGNFVIEGDSAIRFTVEEGSFYDMPLQEVSLEELFVNGPLLIDFKKLAGDMLTIDIKIDTVESHEGYLSFTVKPQL